MCIIQEFKQVANHIHDEGKYEAEGNDRVAKEESGVKHFSNDDKIKLQPGKDFSPLACLHCRPNGPSRQVKYMLRLIFNTS
jgi:hypothetical protein